MNYSEIAALFKYFLQVFLSVWRRDHAPQEEDKKTNKVDRKINKQTKNR